VDLQELYVYPEREQAADVDDEEMAALPQLEGDRLDLEPALRDEVVLGLPLRPLCREDCAGLCVDCGARLENDPGHRHEAEDPRWAALRQLAGDGPSGAN
jgi:uncharacterized protein